MLHPPESSAPSPECRRWLDVSNHSLERGLRTLLGGYLPTSSLSRISRKRFKCRPRYILPGAEPLIGLVLLVLRHDGLAPATARPEDLARRQYYKVCRRAIAVAAHFYLQHSMVGGGHSPQGVFIDQRRRPPRPARAVPTSTSYLVTRCRYQKMVIGKALITVHHKSASPDLVGLDLDLPLIYWRTVRIFRRRRY